LSRLRRLSIPNPLSCIRRYRGKGGHHLMNICGGSRKDYIVEANGNGAAFLDYDNDGEVDVLLSVAPRSNITKRAVIQWSRSTVMSADILLM
jgi:hypothetical protein